MYIGTYMYNCTYINKREKQIVIVNLPPAFMLEEIISHGIIY